MSGASKYSDDYARQAASAFRNRGPRSADDIAAEFRVSVSRLYVWEKRFRDEPDVKPVAPVFFPDDEPSRTGYSTPRRAQDTLLHKAELSALLEERDRLKRETAALRGTIVLLGRG